MQRREMGEKKRKGSGFYYSSLVQYLLVCTLGKPEGEAFPCVVSVCVRRYGNQSPRSGSVNTLDGLFTLQRVLPA